MADTIHSLSAKRIDGVEQSLADYKDKVVMIVNVASACGCTPQYKQLESMYRAYKDRGFAVLGFPANNFGAQEPGSDEEIKTFCSTKYDVSFPMFAKVSAKGDDIHPLYRHLTKESACAGDVAWNFTKFLVGRDGKVVARFEPKTNPDDPTVTTALERALG